MIFYLLLTLFAFQSAKLLVRNELVTGLGINLGTQGTGDSQGSGAETAEFTATLNAAKDALEAGDATSIIAALSATNMEFGNNSNGHWLKIYITDTTGVMLCFHATTVSSLAITNTVGDLFRSSAGAAPQISYPQTFSSVPRIIPVIRDADTTDVFGIRLVANGTDNFEPIVYSASSTTTDVTIYFTVIGEFDDA